MRKYMDEKKRRNTDQANSITQEPTYGRRLVLTPCNAVIRNQTCNAKNGCSHRRGRTHENVPDHVPAAMQFKIDAQGTTQQICRGAITKGASCGADRAAVRRKRLGVNEPAGKGIRDTDQE